MGDQVKYITQDAKGLTIQSTPDPGCRHLIASARVLTKGAACFFRDVQSERFWIEIQMLVKF